MAFGSKNGVLLSPCELVGVQPIQAGLWAGSRLLQVFLILPGPARPLSVDPAWTQRGPSMCFFRAISAVRGSTFVGQAHFSLYLVRILGKAGHMVPRARCLCLPKP